MLGVYPLNFAHLSHSSLCHIYRVTAAFYHFIQRDIHTEFSQGGGGINYSKQSLLKVVQRDQIQRGGGHFLADRPSTHSLPRTPHSLTSSSAAASVSSTSVSWRVSAGTFSCPCTDRWSVQLVGTSGTCSCLHLAAYSKQHQGRWEMKHNNIQTLHLCTTMVR